MAIVIPFKGVLYDPGKVDDFNRVTAPPYDIISPEQQEGYYQNSPHNVIRLILGRQFPDDSESNNRYTRSADIFKKWQNESLLIRDEVPAFYFYHQEFSTPDKKRCSRDGFVGLVRLEDKEKGVIIPHEKTLDKPKEDRLKLMKACSAHFSSIFSLYSDPEDSIVQLIKGVVDPAPLLQATDEEGILHQLWRVSQKEIIAEVTKRLDDQSLFIADGHHRYETALNYRNYQIAHNPQTTGKESYNYVMMYLTAMEGAGLLILPYHRVIHNIENFNFNAFESKLKDYFIVTSFPFNPDDNHEEVWNRFNNDLQECGRTLPAFGMYGSGQTSLHLLRLKENVFHSFADDEASSSVLKKLDVNVIESFIFKNVLGITSKDLQLQENISYVHDSREGFELVRTRGYQLAFFLNNTKSSEIRAIAARGETMPQKSTFFYPKLLSGLVINKIVPDELFEPPWV